MDSTNDSPRKGDTYIHDADGSMWQVVSVNPLKLAEVGVSRSMWPRTRMPKPATFARAYKRAFQSRR